MGFERGGGSNFGFLHRLASSRLQHSRTTMRVCDSNNNNNIIRVLKMQAVKKVASLFVPPCRFVCGYTSCSDYSVSVV